MQGKVFHIQRFSLQDGPGIRTTIFLKGCPLDCAWCHNPESKALFSEIFYTPQRCISCGICGEKCPYGRHLFSEGQHSFLREGCSLCMECVKTCPTKALEACGEEITAEEAVAQALRDVHFYEQSGGGITLSGGEPLMQYDFSLEVLKKAKEKGIHTAVETSGFCRKGLEEISRYVDLWLYDIKLLSEEDHIRYTSVSNRLILENLRLLDSIGARVILRCPIIPDVNFSEKHFAGIAQLARGLKSLAAVHFEPYHPLGISKALRLDKDQPYQNKDFLTGGQLEPFIEDIRRQVNVKVDIL